MTSLQNLNISSDLESQDAVQPAGVQPMTIAFLLWGDLFEDINDPLGLSFEAFCTEIDSGWIYNYINALKLAGVRTVMYHFSARVTSPLCLTHPFSGTKICLLPVPKIYRAYRALIGRKLNRFAGKETEMETVSNAHSDDAPRPETRRSPLYLFMRNAVRSLGSYLSTPLGLLARELRREGCQAIVCQEYEFPRFDACVLLGQFMHLPVFAMFQGGNKMESILEYPLRQLAFRGCTGAIISTQKEIHRVQVRYGLSSAKIARIFDPMDTVMWQAMDRGEARAALGIPLDARVVVWHGRMQMHHKGLDILLEAWNQVCNARPGRDLRLLLLGTGSDASEIRQRIASLQLPGIMWLDEFVRDRAIILRYLSAADVYTLPSRNEGFPIAPIEAMACSLPVVAADVPGVADIFERGEVSGGLVIPCGDATALALALGRVLDNEAWGRELGKRARCRVEECFAPEEIGKQVRNFLLKVPVQVQLQQSQ